MTAQKITLVQGWRFKTNNRDAINRVSTQKTNSEKFKNKYRVQSARLPDYDYSQNGGYFITICTKDREHFFGEIKNGKMELSDMGNIIDSYWKQISEHFPFVQLGESVVMPNHLHGILCIDNEIVETSIYGVSNNNQKDTMNRISTKGGITKKDNPMLHKNISTIIRWFKGRTTFETRKISPDFSWQSRFHDHVIRNEEDLANISEYIQYNPQKWEDDCYFET